MKFAITGLSMAVVILFSSTAFAQAAAAADKGAAVYTAQKCATCHALDGIGSKLKADEIRAWIVTPAEMTKKANATRKPPMKAYASLPKEDLDALVAFLAAKKKK